MKWLIVNGRMRKLLFLAPRPSPEGTCRNGCPRDVSEILYHDPNYANGTGTLFAVAHVLDTLVCTTGICNFDRSVVQRQIRQTPPSWG